MTDNNTNDSLDSYNVPTDVLPKNLNILTILTFIGCGILGLFTLLTPVILNFTTKIMDKALTGGTELSPEKMKDLDKSRQLIELQQANMIPIVATGLIGIAMCLVGAIMMRKLKKDGFWYYVGGQVLPIVASVALMGMAQFTSPWSYVGLLIPVIFIYLYHTQRKFLTK